MSTTLRIAASFLSLAIACTATTTKAEEMKPLFNGKNLEGWVLVNTPPETWSIQDEMLVCTGKPVGEIRTDRMYQNFILEVEWRHMVPKGNAGIFVWADDITSRGVPFHRSIEVQVLENDYGNSTGHTTHGDIFPIHGAEMTPINGRGGSRAFPSEERSKPSPEWNHYRIVCRDGEISLAVNGKVVTQGKECSPRKGYICLESEGGVVHYRNLKIQELPATPIEAKHVAVANRGFRSIYSGLNLDGFRVGAKTNWAVKDWVLGYSASDDSAAAGSIATTEEYGDYAFVLDVRGTDKAQSLEIAPRGESEVVLQFGTAKAQLAQQGWTRIEGNVKGDLLTFTLNGGAEPQQVKLAGKSKRGHLKLMPTGPMEFANLYVR
jgi:hypothetical protein